MLSVDQADSLLAAWTAHWESYGFGYASVQLAQSGTLVGFAGAKHQTILGQPMLNLYYRFDPDAWGHGYASEAVCAVVTRLQSQIPELGVVARVSKNNPGSIRVAQRAGLTIQPATDPRDPIPHHLYASEPLGART